MVTETIYEYFNTVVQSKPSILKNVNEIFYKTSQIDDERYVLYYKKDRIPGISFKTPHFLELTRCEFYIMVDIVEHIKVDLLHGQPLYRIPGILHAKTFSVGKFLCFYTYRSIDEEGEEIIHLSPYKDQMITWVDEWIQDIEKNPNIWKRTEELDYRIHLAEEMINDIKNGL